MKNFLFFLLSMVLSGAMLSATAQCHFRVKTLRSTEFLLPPYSNLKFRSNNSIPRRFNTQYIYIGGLSADYRTSLEALDHAIYKHIRSDGSDPGGANSVSLDNNLGIIYHNEQSLWIYINFRVLFANPQNAWETQYNDLAIDLLKKIAAIASGRWPTVIAQKITERVFNMIPVPQTASLSRYCYVKTDNKAFILLNPDFTLKVDLIEKTTIINGNDQNFMTRLLNIGHFKFDWSANGKIVQNRLAYFPATAVPNNQLANNNIYLISSFADIQNSSQLRTKDFVFVYHPVLKRNNDFGPSNPAPYTGAADNDLIAGNAILAHMGVAEVTNFAWANPDFKSTDNYTKSIFGPRNSMDIEIPVFINGQPRNETSLQTTPGDLSELPEHTRLRRQYQGSYEKVKGNIRNIILLPNDHLNY